MQVADGADADVVSAALPCIACSMVSIWVADRWPIWAGRPHTQAHQKRALRRHGRHVLRNALRASLEEEE